MHASLLLSLMISCVKAASSDVKPRPGTRLCTVSCARGVPSPVLKRMERVCYLKKVPKSLRSKVEKLGPKQSYPICNMEVSRVATQVILTKFEKWDCTISESKALKRTRQLAVLTWPKFFVIDMSTYKTTFSMRRPGRVFELQYDEYGHRLYWMSWGHPPSIGYFHGPRYELKPLIVKKQGNQITNFGVSSCRFAFCYNNNLYWSTPDDDMHHIFHTRPGGPIMMNLQRGTVYVMRDLSKRHELTEFTFDGKIQRTAEIEHMRIAYDNKDSIYLPYISKGIWKVSIETWSNVRLNISTPYNLTITTVRHDRMVLLGIQEMYVFDENLNFLKNLTKSRGKLMGAALMV